MSRSAIAAFAVAVLAVVPFVPTKQKTQIVVCGVLMVVAGYFLLSRTGSKDAYDDRISGSYSDNVRSTINRAAIEMYLSSPASVAFGTGIGTFLERSNELINERYQIHNTYLWLLVEGGPIILISFLVVLFRAVQQCYLANVRATSTDPIAIGCLCALLGSMVWFMAVEGMYQRQFWLLLAMSDAVFAFRMTRENANGHVAPVRRYRVRQGASA
jgi:O-antigen ligase